MKRYCSELECHIQEPTDFVGKVLSEVSGLYKYSEQICFIAEDGSEYVMYHSQNCCEEVSVEDVECDVEDFEGAVVLSFEESTAQEEDEEWRCTWTFYTIDTTKGRLWIRWNGESNGHYSERVSFVEIV